MNKTEEHRKYMRAWRIKQLAKEYKKVLERKEKFKSLEILEVYATDLGDAYRTKYANEKRKFIANA